MTPPDSPSALLERAATLLEVRAAAAEASGDLHVDGDEAWRDWLHMFMGSPVAAAQPLVEWLRDSAASVREHDEDLSADGEPSRYCPNEQQALTFARLVLGESP